MDDGQKYELVIVDGDFRDFIYDLGQPYLHYSELTWTNAVELCRLSFEQGFQCIIWRPDQAGEGCEDDGEEEGGTEL